MPPNVRVLLMTDRVIVCRTATVTHPVCIAVAPGLSNAAAAEILREAAAELDDRPTSETENE